MKQMNLLKKNKLVYGGSLLKTRAGRSGGRPIDTKNSMHMVLKSSKAKGEFSFKTAKNEKAIRQIVNTFSRKYGIQVLSLANVFNHLHFHIRVRNRHAYKAFIRAVTSAIAMVVTGASRWNTSKLAGKFWDYRPFTRVIVGLRAFLSVKDYVEINQFEGIGFSRAEARLIIAVRRDGYQRRI